MLLQDQVFVNIGDTKELVVFSLTCQVKLNRMQKNGVYQVLNTHQSDLSVRLVAGKKFWFDLGSKREKRCLKSMKTSSIF